MPASRSFFLTVPEPDPTVSDVDSQLSARAVAQKAARPVLGRDALGQFLDGDRLRDGLPLLRRPPAARLGRGNIESRLLGPNGCERNGHGGRGTLRKPPRSPPPTIRSAIIRAYGWLPAAVSALHQQLALGPGAGGGADRLGRGSSSGRQTDERSDHRREQLPQAGRLLGRGGPAMDGAAGQDR